MTHLTSTTAPAGAGEALRHARSIPFRRDIEGLRGIAVLLVVLYHAGVPGFSGGYVGVDVFFVLSGYLITQILAKEVRERGSIRYGRFYMRRIKRLLPAVALMTIVVLGLSFAIYAPYEQDQLFKTGGYVFAYVSNLYFAHGSTDYLGFGAENNPLLHTWSLSVEEQFYFVWPLFIVASVTLFKRVGSIDRRIVWSAVVMVVVSFALCEVVLHYNQPWAFFGSPFRGWEFALGALGAMVPQRGAAEPRSRFVEAAGWLGLVGVFAAGSLYSPATPFPGVAALLPTVGTVLALRAGAARSSGALGRALGVRPLQEFGRLSYSWYLWHWPALVLGTALWGDLGLSVRLLLLLVSLGIAELSYRLVESPLRRNNVLGARPLRVIAVAGIVAVVGVGFSIGLRKASMIAAASPGQTEFTEAERDREALACLASWSNPHLKTCEFGEPEADTTVVLLGDSHGGHWIPAARAIVEERGWKLTTMVKAACPIAFTPMVYERVGRDFRECTAWQQEAVEAIEQMRPDLLLVSSTNVRDLSPAEWVEGTERAYTVLSALVGQVGVLRDTPRSDFNVMACQARKEWGLSRLIGVSHECSFPRDRPDAREFLAIQQAAAAKHPNMHIVDVVNAVCPGTQCLARMDGRVAFRDDDHMSDPFSAHLAPVLDSALVAAFHVGSPRDDPEADTQTAAKTSTP